MSTGMLNVEDDVGAEDENAEPDVLTIDDDRTASVLDSVSSETAREILGSVRDCGKTPTELSEEIGTSTQNVRYHLDNLQDAGLVEVRGVRYSEKGREMSVYRPSASPPVIVIGNR